MMTVIQNYYETKDIDSIQYPDRIFSINLRNLDLSHSMIDEMAKDVDESPRYIGNTFDSPIFGICSADKLSGSVKAIILIINDYHRSVYSSAVFGANVYKYLCDISFERDFTLVVESAMSGDLDYNYPICACTEDGRLLHCYGDMFNYGLELE